jgi:histone H3/H4
MSERYCVNRNSSDTLQVSEDILGQFYYAFGQGAGTMRVRRSAIAALRRRYVGPIQAEAATWNTVAANVLSFVTQVGRLASLFATVDGRTAINAADFVKARRLVEAKVHQQADAAGVLIAGPLCPAIPDELQTNPDAGVMPLIPTDPLLTSTVNVRPH